MSRISVALKRFMMLLAIALCGTLALSACTSGADDSASSSSPESSESSEGEWPRTITGDNGEEVTLDSKPEKIVSTSVTLTGTLLSIDAPVKATGSAQPSERLTDDQGFFNQWADVANDKGVKSIYQGEASAEAVLAEEPDLIVVSASGADSAMDIYDQLKDIAPTLVIDYSDKGWQEISEILGEATGHESEAEAKVSEYEARVEEVKNAIDAPAQPVTGLVYTAAKGEDAARANVWTSESAQGELLQDLGFELAEVPESVKGGNAQGSGRSDIIQVSSENFSEAINGESAFLFSANDKAVEAFKSDELLANIPSVKNDAVYALGLDTFRLDSYSTNNALDLIEKTFAK